MVHAKHLDHFVSASTTTPAPSGCKDGEFQCVSDGTCYPGSYECDDYKDCNDNSDEANCPSKYWSFDIFWHLKDTKIMKYNRKQICLASCT